MPALSVNLSAEASPVSSSSAAPRMREASSRVTGVLNSVQAASSSVSQPES